MLLSSLSQQRVAVIGGGISGLAAVQRITELQPAAKVSLFEAADRLGGIIQSTRVNDFLFEHAADSFIVSPELPWAGELCEKIGLELFETSPENRGAMIVRNGQLHPVPSGLQLMTIHQLLPLFQSPLLSWKGKLRVAAERFIVKKCDEQEESLAQFTRRRYGNEMFERIVQPLVSGIYTADPERLSMAAALPQYVKLEQQYGSIAKAAKQSPESRSTKGARYSLFRSPAGGMQSLVDAIEANLAAVEIHKSTKVTTISRGHDQWQVEIGDRSETFDGIVLATASRAIPKLVAKVAPALSADVETIEHVSTAVVCLGFRRNQISHVLNAFGCVVPSIERRRILAISFANVKFPSRAPEDCVLLRVFVGGALQPEVLEHHDDELVSIVCKELDDLLGIVGEPACQKVVRWPSTTPQYNMGHRQTVAKIREAEEKLPAFAIAGNAYAGVGIPQCVRSGWAAADRVVEAITSQRGG